MYYSSCIDEYKMWKSESSERRLRNKVDQTYSIHLYRLDLVSSQLIYIGITGNNDSIDHWVCLSDWPTYTYSRRKTHTRHTRALLLSHSFCATRSQSRIAGEPLWSTALQQLLNECCTGQKSASDFRKKERLLHARVGVERWISCAINRDKHQKAQTYDGQMPVQQTQMASRVGSLSRAER